MAEQGRVLPGKHRVGPTSARRPKPLEPCFLYPDSIDIEEMIS